MYRTSEASAVRRVLISELHFDVDIFFLPIYAYVSVFGNQFLGFGSLMLFLSLKPGELWREETQRVIVEIVGKRIGIE